VVSGLVQPAEVFAQFRPLLFSIAYRMLGSVATTEDVLQEAFLRFDGATRDRGAWEGRPIQSPKAYLSAIVTRLAIDELRSARARREAYVGVWLPEPLVADDAAAGGRALSVPIGDRVVDPQSQAETAETLSMAFLLVLDRLDPVARAVFLLHDVFGYPFREIAGIVDRGEADCRQIAVRARRRVRARRPRLDPVGRRRDEVGRRFFAAMAAGDVDAVMRLVAPDVVVMGDGGGKAPQWAAEIVGMDRVSRLVAGLGRQIGDLALQLEVCRVNGQPGAVVRTSDGSVVNVFELEIGGGLVRAVRSVINPDKLRHLGPVADVRALAGVLHRARARRSPA
jgi:RNA polymerase sigma-70 factor (ECF subfamily)